MTVLSNMKIFIFVLIFFIIPLVTAPIGFPFGVFFNLFHHYKKNSYDDEVKAKFLESIPKNYNLTKAEIFTKDKLHLQADFFDYGKSQTLIVVPGFRNSCYLNFSCIAKKFIQKNYNILMTHQRAYSESEGKFCGVGLSEQYDLLEWINWIDKNSSVTKKIVLYGVSMGASTVGYASDKITNSKVKAIILDSPYDSFFEQIWLSAKKLKFLEKPVMNVCNFMANFFLKLPVKKTVSDSLKNTKIPAFFVYGSEDKTIPISIFQKVYYNCNSKKDFVIVQGAKHIKGFEVGGEEIQEKIFEFIKCGD